MANSTRPEQRRSLLVVGPPNCGKTTLVRRLRYSRGEHIPIAHLASYKTEIYGNIITLAIELAQYLRRTEKVGYNRVRGRALEKALGRTTSLQDYDLKIAIYDAYYNTSAQHDLEKFLPEDLQLPVSSQYFLHDILRFGGVDYAPTARDILRSWTNNAAVQINEGPISSLGHSLVDVHEVSSRGRIVSEELTAKIGKGSFSLIIVCIPLDAYSDKGFFSDLVNSTNHVTKSAGNTPVVVVFNQRDLFTQKLKTTPLAGIYPDFQPKENRNIVDEAISFIEDMFLSRLDPEDNVDFCSIEATGPFSNASFVNLVEKVLVGSRSRT